LVKAAQFCLAAHAAAEDISSAPQRGCVCPREGNKELGLFDFPIELAFAPQREHRRLLPTDRDQVAAPLNDRQVADLVNDQERGPGTGSGSVRAAGHGGFRTGKGQGTIRIFPRRSGGAARASHIRAARGPGSEMPPRSAGLGSPGRDVHLSRRDPKTRCFWHPSTSNWPALARRVTTLPAENLLRRNACIRRPRCPGLLPRSQMQSSRRDQRRPLAESCPAVGHRA
jgi:hypothetical protein